MVMDVYDLKEKSRFLVHMESETWKLNLDSKLRKQANA